MSASECSGEDGVEVEYYESGHGAEVMARAESCEHMVFRWSLNSEEKQWEKKCVFCPAVLETADEEESPFVSD